MAEGSNWRSLDEWRGDFAKIDSDIFSVIKHAILVAACDYPHDLKLRRDGLAELMFSPNFPKCCGCQTQPSEKIDGDDDDDDRSCGDAETLVDENEQETRLVDEVARIKLIVDDPEEESDASLCKLLRRLQQMPLTAHILKDTRIGKPINALRMHESKDVRDLAQALIEEWRSWILELTTTMAGEKATKESLKTPVINKKEEEEEHTDGEEEEEEEVGLPSPPMDEGYLLSTPVPIELSKIFDGLDDDGNFVNDVEIDKNAENGKTWSPINLSPPQREMKESMLKKPNQVLNAQPKPGRKSSSNEVVIPKWLSKSSTNSVTTSTKLQESALNTKPIFCKPNREPKPSKLGEPKFPKPKPGAQLKINDEVKVNQKFEKGRVLKKPASQLKEKSSINDDQNSLAMKLEIAKRKLQEGYRMAKRQRTIQIVEFSDVPKQQQQSVQRGIRAGGPATSNRR